MPKNKLKFFISNILLTITTVIVSILICEILTRFLYKENTVLFPRYHTDVKYGDFTLRRTIPNSNFWHISKDGSWQFRINNQGFRNDKNFEYKKEKKLRILSLGDSHTQGYEVRQEYTFSAIIEKYLNSKGYDSEVINSGISGFSTAEELVFLENEGIKYKPDIVVLGFYANDYQDNINANLFSLNQKKQLIVEKKEYIPGVKIQNIIYSLSFTKWLGENSYFYSVLFNSTWQFFKTRATKNTYKKTMELSVVNKSVFPYYQKKLTESLIKRMYIFCKKNNIKFIIIDIPRIENKTKVKTSFYGSLKNNIREFCDEVILSEETLKDYIGIAEIHKPNGHKHITEFTHINLGINAAKKIISLKQVKNKFKFDTISNKNIN